MFFFIKFGNNIVLPFMLIYKCIIPHKAKIHFSQSEVTDIWFTLPTLLIFSAAAADIRFHAWTNNRIMSQERKLWISVDFMVENHGWHWNETLVNSKWTSLWPRKEYLKVNQLFFENQEVSFAAENQIFRQLFHIFLFFQDFWRLNFKLYAARFRSLDWNLRHLRFYGNIS